MIDSAAIAVAAGEQIAQKLESPELLGLVKSLCPDFDGYWFEEGAVNQVWDWHRFRVAILLASPLGALNHAVELAVSVDEQEFYIETKSLQDDRRFLRYFRRYSLAANLDMAEMTVATVLVATQTMQAAADQDLELELDDDH